MLTVELALAVWLTIGLITALFLGPILKQAAEIQFLCV